MIIDSQLLFSDAQAFSADAASTNYLDLGVARNLFDGEPMAVVIQVDVAADHTTGDETYAFKIQCDDNTSFSSATDLVSATILYSDLTAGAIVVLPIPIGVSVERYLRVYFDGGGTTPTVTATIFLQPLSMVQKNKVYADNITIS